MLSALRFETQPPRVTASPNRADVACFVGYVQRRPAALPAEVQAGLRAAGWLDGPWSPPAAQLETLWQVPVCIDSWDQFDALFAWNRRALRNGGRAMCSSYLGAAVRSFFANGGRRCHVIRVGDPWPYLGGLDRSTQRIERLAALVPALDPAARPFDGFEPSSWLGIEHLFGLGDVSHVCLPDLADICAPEPVAVPVEREQPGAAEDFVECSPDEPAEPLDLGLSGVRAPRLGVEGFTDWTQAVAETRRFLAARRRDVLMLAALPMAADGAVAAGFHADAEPLDFWRATGVLEASDGDAPRGAASAFVQLAWPWLRTRRSDDLPERLESADGLMAGRLAANALGRGAWRSVAGTRLADVLDLQPMLAIGAGEDDPAARLAARVCLIGPEPDGITLLSDVTASPDDAWRGGGTSRLMAQLLRAARAVGEAHAFDANGEALWGRVRRSVERALEGIWRAGGLGGSQASEAFEVRCGRDTMSQNDLDNGRLRVEVSVLPAAAVERITVAFDLAGPQAQFAAVEVL